MRKMSRLLLPAALLLSMLCLFCAPARAAEPEFDSAKEIRDMLEESGVNSLSSLLPDEGRTLLRENGVDAADPDTVLNISFWDLLRSGWTSVKAAAAQPLAVLVNSIGVILLCALLNSMQTSFGGGAYDRVFSTVSVLCVGGIVIGPATELIRRSAELIEQMSRFFTSFIPVYVGVITASGRPATGMVCNAALMGMAQVISRISTTVLVPLLAVYLALCLMGGAAREINMEGIARAVKNVVVTLLTFLLTVFVGLLSVQGAIAASTDTVALKTAKFAVGTFLPVVGSALSEALSTLQGCMGVVRSTVGGFGILAAAAAFLPPVVSLLLMKLALLAAGGVGEALGTDRVASLLRAASSALTLILGILLVFAALFLVSVSLMLALTRE